MLKWVIFPTFLLSVFAGSSLAREGCLKSDYQQLESDILHSTGHVADQHIANIKKTVANCGIRFIASGWKERENPDMYSSSPFFSSIFFQRKDMVDYFIDQGIAPYLNSVKGRDLYSQIISVPSYINNTTNLSMLEKETDKQIFIMNIIFDLGVGGYLGAKENRDAYLRNLRKLEKLVASWRERDDLPPELMNKLVRLDKAINRASLTMAEIEIEVIAKDFSDIRICNPYDLSLKPLKHGTLLTIEEMEALRKDNTKALHNLLRDKNLDMSRVSHFKKDIGFTWINHSPSLMRKINRVKDETVKRYLLQLFQ